MTQSQIETEAQTGAMDCTLGGLTQGEWAKRFGVGTDLAMSLIRSAFESIFTSDPEIQRVGPWGERGSERKRKLKAHHMEQIISGGAQKLVLSTDIQEKVRGLIALRQKESQKSECIRVKELNGLIPSLNYLDIILLVNIMQQEHPEWFREADQLSKIGKKRWWLLRIHKGAFLKAAESHIQVILDKKVLNQRMEFQGHKSLETNTQGLVGWGATGFEDVLEGRMYQR